MFRLLAVPVSVTLTLPPMGPLIVTWLTPPPVEDWKSWPTLALSVTVTLWLSVPLTVTLPATNAPSPLPPSWKLPVGSVAVTLPAMAVPPWIVKVSLPEPRNMTLPPTMRPEVVPREAWLAPPPVLMVRLPAISPKGVAVDENLVGPVPGGEGDIAAEGAIVGQGQVDGFRGVAGPEADVAGGVAAQVEGVVEYLDLAGECVLGQIDDPGDGIALDVQCAADQANGKPGGAESVLEGLQGGAGTPYDSHDTAPVEFRDKDEGLGWESPKH